MGMSYAQQREEQLKKEQLAREARRADADRAAEAVAARIVMVVIDMINRDLIRPGPVAEERECYVMSQELRDMDERMTTLVHDVIVQQASRLRHLKVS